MRSQLPPLAHVSVIVGHCWSTCVELLHHSEFIKMLLLSNRIKVCSLAFTAARLYSSGPAAANKNPLVYFDIAADKEPLGRVTFEVSRLKISVDTACISLHVNVSVRCPHTVADLLSPDLKFLKNAFWLLLFLLQLNAEVVPKTAGI